MFWHIKSFEDYLKEDMNPLGLQIFPNLEGLDSDFKLAWENILRTYSREIMQLIIREYTRRSRALDSEIESTCSQLQTFKTHKTFEEREMKLQKHLEIFNKNILIKMVNTAGTSQPFRAIGPISGTLVNNSVTINLKIERNIMSQFLIHQFVLCFITGFI